MPDQSDIDNILSNKIKKFNSERNLFFSNIYNETLDNCYEKGRNKVTKSNSFLKQSSSFLLKKCKSTKDLFTRTEEKLKTPILSKKISSGTYYDPFEREYLFSENRKNIVKELRKNFETNPSQQEKTPSPKQKTPKLVRRTSTAYRKSEFAVCDISNHENININNNGSKYNIKQKESIKSNNLLPSSRHVNNPIFKPQIPKIEDLFPQYYGTQLSDDTNPKSYTISSRLQDNNNIYQQYLQNNYNGSKYGAKRSGSLNHIDIDILKAELDHCTEPKGRRSDNFSYRVLRRYNSYKVCFL